MEMLARVDWSILCLMQELNTDWQRAASGLLVSIGLHLPDLVSIFVQVELALCRMWFETECVCFVTTNIV